MNGPIRILYVDDYPLDRELVRDALERETGDFKVTEASSRTEFEQVLAQGSFDLVLSDFNILGFEGLQVLEAVHQKAPHLPVIIVTGTGSEEVAAEAIKRGAADYVLKTPKHIRRLPHTIHQVLEKELLEQQRLQAEANLRESNELLSLFMKHSPIYAYIKQVQPGESRVLLASENFVDLTGITGSSMTGKNMDELFAPEFADKITADDEAVIENGKVLQIEEDLNDRNYVTIKFPIRLGSKNLLAGYTIDITRTKQSEREVQRRLKDLEVLYESSLALSSQLDPPEVGKVVIDLLKANLHWNYAVVLLRQEIDERLEAIGFSAPGVTPENTQAEIQRFYEQIGEGERGIIGWVLRNGQSVRSGDLAADPRFVPDYPGINSGLYAPMIAGEKVIGVIAVESELANAFNELDERLLTTLSKITANAIHRNRLRKQTEHQLERLAALRAIDQAISSSFDLRITLDIFLKNAVAQLGADAALLLRADPAMNTLEYAAEYGFYGQAVRKIRLSMTQEAAGRVALERRMVSIPDLREHGQIPVHTQLVAGELFVTYHAVPLIVKGQVKGVLEIFQRTYTEPKGDWLEFLETLAGQAAIAIDNNQLFESLQRTNSELGIAYDETIEGWSTAMDMRDHETEGHTQRVTRVTQQLGFAQGMTGMELVHLRRGSLLHDIGKMGVPDNILLKPGPLSDEEWDIMHRHPRLAYEMLAPVTYLRPALDIPYCHHEKWDGSGYPRGLKGEQIPIAARLFTVVDVWDALRSDRPYRKKWPDGKVLEYIRGESGTRFDPRAVETFFQILEKTQE